MSEQTEAGTAAVERAPKPRRRRRVEGGRQHRHEVKVTPEEEGQLVRLALRYRVSIPKLLVDSALAGGASNAAANESVRDELLAQLFSAHRLLAGIANNVNQIAKAANSTGDMPTQTPEVLAAVRRVAERIDALVDRLSS